MANRCFTKFKSSDFKHFKSASNSINKVFIRNQHYDIAVVGGGLVGTAMACAVAKHPQLYEKSILLLEAAPEKNFEKKSVGTDYSNRVVSLNPGTRKLLEKIGVWKHLDGRYKVVKKIQVWDACSDALITFNDDLVNDVSYIVENDQVLYALSKVSKELSSSIDILYESKIKNVELPKPYKPVKMELENGDKHTCSLLIGADGANSQIRKFLGCQYLTWDYHQKGIVATLKLSEPTENVVSWQRFLPTGPVALLPLTNELSSLVWSTSTEEAESLLRMTDETFVDAVNDALWKSYPKSEIVQSTTNYVNKILETLTLTSNAVRQLPPSISSVVPKSRGAFPLAFGHSTKYIGPGVALIGDAAHRVHPLAGQGLNLGFGDVECLTCKLAECVYSGKRLCPISTLAEYESERQKELVPMLAMIDFLQKLYSTSFTPVVLLRSVGVQVTHAFHIIKNKLVERASI